MLQSSLANSRTDLRGKAGWSDHACFAVTVQAAHQVYISCNPSAPNHTTMLGQSAGRMLTLQVWRSDSSTCQSMLRLQWEPGVNPRSGMPTATSLR